MMASTHAVIGVISYAGACAFAGHTPSPLGLGCAAVGAWLPDADTPSSKAGMCLYPFALWMERKFGHRTITHSLVGVLCFALLLVPLLLFASHPVLWFSALLCGYFSHLLADAATKSGVPLLWPSRARFVFPGNEDLRVKTGSGAEMALFACLVLFGLLLIPVVRYGPRRLLHVATGSMPGAVRDVEDWSEDHNLQAQIEGFDVLNQRLVQGTYHIVGRRGDGKLVVERDSSYPGHNTAGGYWLLADSGEETHRIAPRRVRVQQLGLRTDETRTLRVSNVTLAALSRALSNTMPRGDALELLAAHAQNPTMAELRDTRSEGVNAILVTGAGDCHPFPQDALGAPVDVPQFGLKTVVFSGRRVAFDLAQLRHLSAAGTRVTLKSATLSVRLPRGAKVSNLLLPTRRQVIVATSLRRHADLLVREGDLVRAGQVLSRTFAQELEREPTTQERLLENRAEAAHRELLALEAEERAMKRSSLWGELRFSFAQRRRALETQAAWRMPPAPRATPPRPVSAPFDAVVEAVEWEPPTVPTQRGERPEHAARVTLVQVLR